MNHEQDNALAIFNFEDREIRRVMIDGDPWAVGKDVSDALGYAWRGSRTFIHVPAEWKRVRSVRTLRGDMQDMVLLSREGLLFFLGRSDKPKAIPMQKWAWGTVIPSVLETGSYSVVPAPTVNLTPFEQFQNTANAVIAALGGSLLETRLLAQATDAKVEAVTARVEEIAAQAAPERISETVKTEVSDFGERFAAEQNYIGMCKAHVGRSVKHYVERCLQHVTANDPRRPRLSSEAFRYAWDKIRTHAQVNAFGEIRTRSQIERAMDKIDELIALTGYTPAPRPQFDTALLQQRIDGLADPV